MLLLLTVVVFRHQQDVCSEIINNTDSCMEVYVLLPLWHVIPGSGWQWCFMWHDTIWNYFTSKRKGDIVIPWTSEKWLVSLFHEKALCEAYPSFLVLVLKSTTNFCDKCTSSSWAAHPFITSTSLPLTTIIIVFPYIAKLFPFPSLFYLHLTVVPHDLLIPGTLLLLSHLKWKCSPTKKYPWIENNTEVEENKER